MTATTPSLRAPPLRTSMIPMATPGARALRTTVIPATASGMATFWPTQPLVPTSGLWATTASLCGFAALLPHFNHMLRRASLASTGLRTTRASESFESTSGLRATSASLCGFAALLPHLDHMLRRGMVGIAHAKIDDVAPRPPGRVSHRIHFGDHVGRQSPHPVELVVAQALLPLVRASLSPFWNATRFCAIVASERTPRIFRQSIPMGCGLLATREDRCDGGHDT